MKWLPTRLIDVGLKDGVVKLIETKELSKEPCPPYFALSHRWGASSDQMFRLLRNNRSTLMKCIPMDQISGTFKDAIKFTKGMAVPYLWADSICILQDSLEEWNTEAALMDKVYAQSLCNIAASYASNHKESSSERLFYTRTPRDVCTFPTVDKVITRQNHQELYQLSLNSNYMLDSHNQNLLYKRAWVLQEQLLSPRTIHFSKQLFWECREERASETFPHGLSHQYNHYPLTKEWKSGLQSHGYKFWHDTLNQYLRCYLTYPSDRLAAIGAIAREYQKELNDTYLAGLWKKELPLCLLWRIHRELDSFPTRAKVYRCPTWSWASLDFSNPVTLTNFEVSAKSSGCKTLARVVEAEVTSPPGRTYTDYHGGYIQLEGKIYPTMRAEPADSWSGGSPEGRGRITSVFEGGYPTKNDFFLDVETHEVDRSSLYTFPVALDVTSDHRFIHCLVLKCISKGGREFERVGVSVIHIEAHYRPRKPELLHLISKFAANYPFSGDLDTIKIF